MKTTILGALGVLVLAPAVFASHAIPAFARKYRTSCTTCHVGFPKLNDFGEAFRLNGFQIPGEDELFVKDAPVPLGSEPWKELFPKAVWPGEIPNLPPVAFRTSFGMAQESGAETKANFEVPQNFVLLAGGTLGRDIAFFVHQGGGPRYYVQFSNLLEGRLPERSLQFTAGLMEPSVLPVSNARRLTASPYLVSTYDLRTANGNGNRFAFDRQIAAEFSGVVEHRARWVLGVSNGANDAADNNSKKDLYGRLAWKIGGLPFDGLGQEIGESLAQTENWQDNSLTSGLFGWLGRNTRADATAVGETFEAAFRRVGFDLRANWRDLDLVGGAVYGQDRDPGNDGLDVGSTLEFVEATYVVYPWLLPTLRFENLRFRGPGPASLDDEEVRRVVAGVSAYVRANLRVVAEGQFNSGAGERDTGDVFLLQFEFAF